MTSKRKKLIIARDRQIREQEEQLALSKLEKQRQKIVEQKFSRTTMKRKIKLSKLPDYQYDRVDPFLPPKLDKQMKVNRKRVETDPLMVLREERANKQYKLMQTRIAPAYNKGPDIYVSDGMVDDYVNGRTKRR